MSAAWGLLLAAAALIVVAVWCAGAQRALARADSDGLDRYGSLLTLISLPLLFAGAGLTLTAIALGCMSSPALRSIGTLRVPAALPR